jgi:hypothetical protein
MLSSPYQYAITSWSGEILTPSLLGTFREMPKTTGNLNGQTMAQLPGEHDNLPAMMTFMCDEIG